MECILESDVKHESYKKFIVRQPDDLFDDKRTDLDVDESIRFGILIAVKNHIGLFVNLWKNIVGRMERF